MTNNDELTAYKEKIKKHLEKLTPIFAKASIGDFSSTIEVPEENDEFVQLYAGIQIMLEVIRDQLAQLSKENQIKTEFLMLAAHQLRTPLASMRWNLEAILDPKITQEEFKSKLKKIHQSNLKMISLVNDLLNITRIEEQKHEEQFRVLDPTEVIEAIVQESEPLAKQKNIRVSFVTHKEKLPKIMTSPKYFQETVRNLLNNAIKYNKPNGTVVLKLKQQDEHLLFSIQDTGIGIPQSESDRVFTQFFRGQNAVTQEPEGTGLGLFLVKSFIDRFGGRIWFESQENVGTTFYVDLPVIARPQEVTSSIDK